MRYEFYWEDGDGEDKSFDVSPVLIDITTSSLGADEPEVIEKLLTEYMKENPDDYNIDEWIEFLQEKGYDAERVLGYDYAINFQL